MIYALYTIRDNLVGFGSPMAAENDPVAVRMFEHAFKMSDSIFRTRPSEYDLYYIGDYNTDTAEITSTVPRLICNCSDFIKE